MRNVHTDRYSYGIVLEQSARKVKVIELKRPPKQIPISSINIYITFKGIYEARSKNILMFCSYLSNVKYFSKNIFMLFRNIPNRSIHFCHLRGSFCIPTANHEVDLPPRYRFTAEIKAALVSYLFPARTVFRSGNMGARSVRWDGIAT